MSQHLDPTPKETDINALNSKLTRKVLTASGTEADIRLYYRGDLTFTDGNCNIDMEAIKTLYNWSLIGACFPILADGNSGMINRCTIDYDSGNIQLRGVTNSGQILTGNTIKVMMLLVGIHN